MLTTGRLLGILKTTDYARAREFYEGTLGFHFVSLDQYALALRAGENMIRISKTETFKPLEGTVLGWEVDDVKATVLWLKSRHVTTEKYAFVADQELGIWCTPNGDQVAWFRDPDGNILSVSHHV